MTTSFEHPSNGYRVTVSDGACFVWTLLFGGLFFLVRGNVRHFVIGFILGACTLGISWLLYPFFASGILRTMYLERGYREVRAADPSSSASSAFAFVLLLLVAAGGAYWWLHIRPAQRADSLSTSIAQKSATLAAPQFATTAEAQNEAIRLYPALGVAGSDFNRAFLTRHKQYQKMRPDYFRDPAWPIALAREVAATTTSK